MADQVNLAMNDPLWYGNGSGTFADAVSRMFEKGYLTSWETFSSTIHNNPKDVSNTNYMSIEYIHNIVHVSRMLSTIEIVWKLTENRTLLEGYT